MASRLSENHATMAYPTLKDREIRLLNLRFVGGSLDCQLRVANLDDRPVYKAISYTWGPATKGDTSKTGGIPEHPQGSDCFVNCNNNPKFRVTKNLHDCLLQLSQNSSLAMAEYWIDAVCIDQENWDERSVHVSMMSHIYHQAEEVIVWLGLRDDSTPLAYEMMKHLGSVWSNQRSHLRERSTDEPHFTGLAELLLQTQPATGSSEAPRSDTDTTANTSLGQLHTRAHWQSIFKFFSRRWFTRSWVVQEFVLAAKPVILCGDMIFDWAHVEATSDFLATQLSRNTLALWVGEDFDMEMAAFKAPAKLEAVKGDLRRRHPSTLLRSLIRCRDYDCKDDKDKVFSVLGIHQTVTQTQLIPGQKLYPNYELDIEVIYRNAAVHIIQEESDLGLLAVSEGEDFCHRHKFPHLPSWAPDWSFGTRKTSLGLGITGYGRFNASKDMEREITFSEDDMTLFVKAARLDKIARIGETKESVQNGATFDQWLDILASPELNHRPREEVLDAFWRTLITDTDRTGRVPAPHVLQVGFSEWITRKGDSLDLGRRRRIGQLCSGEEGPQTVSLLETRDGLAELYELQYAHALHLRPFLTSEGHLGLGSQSMKAEAGEKQGCEYSVWIVCGSRVPLIFRDTGRTGRYCLVGGAYVHGFMQGEAIHSALEFVTVGLE